MVVDRVLPIVDGTFETTRAIDCTTILPSEGKPGDNERPEAAGRQVMDYGLPFPIQYGNATESNQVGVRSGSPTIRPAAGKIGGTTR
jgi:hypothetical protein